MKKRIPLAQRLLPDYTWAEELTNMITHIVGGAFGIIALILCVARAAYHRDVLAVWMSAIYCLSMIALYTMSSVYHGLRRGTGKKVLQIIDHCTIYLLIAGTYTPIVMCALRPVYPAIGWGLMLFVWSLAILATVLTAIDLKAYRAFSMVCYIGMGWGILPFFRQVYAILSPVGFYLLLAGGIAYTIGAVLYGIGSKVRWMHSVFHIFVVIGSVLHFFAFYFYGI